MPESRIVVAIAFVMALAWSVGAQTPPQQAETPTLQILVDYSGSMHGAPLSAARHSTQTALDLSVLWAELYPERLSGLEVDYIAFGGPNDARRLFTVAVADGAELGRRRREARTHRAYFHETDYAAALGLAAAGAQGRAVHTVMLTDAIDEGRGPSAATDYRVLVGTRFLIYGEGDFPEDSPWLTAIPGATPVHVEAGHEITTALAMALFEFVDDIRRYLVRRGVQPVRAGTIETVKHAAAERHTLLLSGQRAPEVTEVRHVATGRVLPADAYVVRGIGALTQVSIRGGEPAGAYRIALGGGGDDTELAYISFERADLAVVASGGRDTDAACAGAGTSYSPGLHFVDRRTGAPVTYADFLSHAAVRYALTDPDGRAVVDFAAEAPIALARPVSLPSMRTGTYTMSTAWNYSLGELGADTVSMLPAGEVCVDEKAFHLEVAFDTAQAYQARALPISARLTARATGFDFPTEIALTSASGPVDLVRDGTTDTYHGTLAELQPGRLRLTLHPSAISAGIGLRPTPLLTHDVGRRQVRLSAKREDRSGGQAVSRSHETVSFGHWLATTFGMVAHGTPVAPERAYGYAVRLPYEDAYDEIHEFGVSVEPLFPDEVATLRIDASADRVVASKEVRRVGLLGALLSYRADTAAVTVRLSAPASSALTPVRPTATAAAAVAKVAGGVDLGEGVRPAPSLTVAAEVVRGGQTTLELAPVELELNVRTSAWGMHALQKGYLALLLFIAAALAVAGLCLFVWWIRRRRRYFVNKALWSQCERLSPQDFYAEFPEALRAWCERRAGQGEEGAGGSHVGSKAMARAIRADGVALANAVSRHAEADWLRGLGRRLRSPRVDGVRHAVPLPHAGEAVIRVTDVAPDSSSGAVAVLRTRSATADHHFDLRYDADHPGRVWVDVQDADVTAVGFGGSRTRLRRGTHGFSDLEALAVGPDPHSPIYTATVRLDGGVLALSLSRGFLPIPQLQS